MSPMKWPKKRSACRLPDRPIGEVLFGPRDGAEYVTLCRAVPV